MSFKTEWRRLSLKAAGVILIDCDHRTPPAAASGYPYIAIPQLKDGNITLDGVRRISESDFADWTKKLSPQGNDVIVVRRCNSGQSAHVPDGLKCAIGQNLVVLRADGKTVLPEYLRWLVRGDEWWAEVAKYINVGAVFDSLRCRDIPNFELMIPPIDVQRGIAELLAAIDGRIILLRETNATLEAIAQALFKSWFVDFDPVRAKMEGRAPEGIDEAVAALFPNGLTDSKLGLLPTGWNASRLDSIADVVMGLSPSGDSYNDNGTGTPLINGPVEFGEYFPELKKWTSTPTRYSKAGDLIFCVRGSTTGKRVVSDGEYCIGRGVAAIRSKNSCNEFVRQTINFGLQRLLEKTTGSVFPSLSAPDIKEFLVLVPDMCVLELFQNTVEPIEKKIQENYKQVQTFESLRDTLLPRLISGQLRIQEAKARIDALAA